MKPYKRPEKETDPDKLPGQIVNRPPHLETPLVKEVEEYKERTVCPFCKALDVNCKTNREALNCDGGQGG